MAKLRLIKVIVHPILVLDDGENLTEFENGPSEIPAADWPSFPERLKADIAEAEKQLNEQAIPAEAKPRNYATDPITPADHVLD